MPCPYFEPRQLLLERTQPNARLPLIDEYDGVCRAAEGEPKAVDAAHRMRLCNHGNARGLCGHFPAEEERSCFRFDVLRQSVAHLDVLFIAETFYAPTAWRRLAFHIDGERLDPDPADPCERAQMIAFCRSYLQHHPIQENVKS
jgi:hypothetical protein